MNISAAYGGGNCQGCIGIGRIFGRNGFARFCPSTLVGRNVKLDHRRNANACGGVCFVGRGNESHHLVDITSTAQIYGDSNVTVLLKVIGLDVKTCEINVAVNCIFACNCAVGHGFAVFVGVGINAFVAVKSFCHIGLAIGQINGFFRRNRGCGIGFGAFGLGAFGFGAFGFGGTFGLGRTFGFRRAYFGLGIRLGRAVVGNRNVRIFVVGLYDDIGAEISTFQQNVVHRVNFAAVVYITALKLSFVEIIGAKISTLQQNVIHRFNFAVVVYVAHVGFGGDIDRV